MRRVGDHWDDQMERSGHAQRLEDVDRLAALGIRRVRYPVLWERAASNGPAQFDWHWPDARLGRLQALGLAPIVGLLHHGSGPGWTSLRDPDFPRQFARYARAVAERYPWVDAYTPINEPLTTARFSALYGHWYPHERNDRAFVRLQLQQCRAIVLAMRAIRQVRPDAVLLQTEDLGAVHATPPLQYQAEFENHRRWLTVDLLAGRVDRHHPLWSYLRSSGASEEDLAEARDDSCAPDLLGINHYVTSERFLDHRLDRHPPGTHGGNGRERYADVAAVRADGCTPIGVAGLLRTAWDRYRIPLVVSEAHLGCTREHQLRWLDEVFAAACTARSAGVDVRAVTVWSMFGAFDWASLLTRVDGVYEPGAFDVRAPAPRPTAIAAMTRALATSGAYDHPVLDGAGWWTRPGQRRPRAKPPRVLAIVGSTSDLGAALCRACEDRDLPFVRAAPDAPTPAAAWAVIDARPAGTGPLAFDRLAPDVPLLTFSTDEVFATTSGRPYVESDRPRPVTARGRSMVARERGAWCRSTRPLILRTGPLFGPGLPPLVADGVARSPTFIIDLVSVSLDLLIDGAVGTWHLVSGSETPPGRLRYPSRRLASERAALMPPLADALERFPEARDVLPQSMPARARR